MWVVDGWWVDGAKGRAGMEWIVGGGKGGLRAGVVDSDDGDDYEET